jgi:hypothetical protein
MDQALFSSDSINRAEAKAIIQKYGWPTISEIGKDGQNNLWLLVPHADDDVCFQKQALAGMLPFRIYALTYGFHYVPVTAPQAQAKERADSLYTQRLIDSAQHFYLRKDFNQAYNYYNAASMI